MMMTKESKTTRAVVHRNPSGHDQESLHEQCRALGTVLDKIGDKWTMMVIGSLSNGPVRFNALLRLIGGVSHRMLTLTLRGLEADGLVNRTVYPTVPPQVEYALTPVGVSLIESLNTLCTWAQKHQAAIETGQTKSP